MRKALILILALALAGCTSIRLPDGATITRVGYGAVIQYQRISKTLPDGSTTTTEIVVTRSEADAALLRQVAETVMQYQKPPGL